MADQRGPKGGRERCQAARGESIAGRERCQAARGGSIAVRESCPKKSGGADRPSAVLPGCDRASGREARPLTEADQEFD